jgi:hypothetical protein
MKYFRRVKAEGVRLEWYYGLAYHDWELNCAYYYPIPINFIVRYAKAIRVLWDKFRGNPSWIDDQILKGIARHEYERNSICIEHEIQSRARKNGLA